MLTESARGAAHGGALPAAWGSSRGWIIAVVSTFGVLGLRLALQDLLEERAPYLASVVAITVSAWCGGLYPGLFSTSLSALGVLYLFVPPFYSLALKNRGDIVNLGLFCVVGVLISIICERLRRQTARVSAEAAERKRAEAELQEWAERLRLALALEAAQLGKKRAEQEREALLESERAAREEAMRANRMKDEFLAMVSHELRTPLNAILGWTTLLRRSSRSAEQVEKGLSSVERNTRLLSQLISDLLDVSRIVSGKMHMELEPVDLSAVMESALEACRGAAAARGIAIADSIEPVEGVARGDAGRLQQVVTNLLTNAIKFTPPGGKVEVSLGQRGDRVEIVVRDSGQGIDPEFLPHVFGQFRQADASMARRHHGLGLGLSIVKHLVEMHGGQVRAESEGIGKGATFTVELPCCEDEWIAPRPAEVEGSWAGAREAVGLAGVRVLVVDDDADARELARRVLVEHGAEVVAVASAPDALAMLRERPPSVLVSDIGMPGMDGYALIREVRAWERGRGSWVPAVAMTAFSRPEDRARALGAGYQLHVSKPVEPHKLVAAVAGLLLPQAA